MTAAPVSMVAMRTLLARTTKVSIKTVTDRGWMIRTRDQGSLQAQMKGPVESAYSSRWCCFTCKQGGRLARHNGDFMPWSGSGPQVTRLDKATTLRKA